MSTGAAEREAEAADALTAARLEGDAALAASFAHCHDVAHQRARNFYYGMKLTPEPKRSAMYAVYAWMRLADDLADEPGSIAEKTRRLEAFREQTLAVLDSGAPLPQGALWPAMRRTFCQYRIPRDCLEDMIAGQLIDQRKTQYETFDELYDYCYKVAGTVGLVCLSIWGYHGGSATRRMAEHRGIALQLTNIIRDVAEDTARGRCYFPRDEFDRFGYTPRRLAAGKPCQSFDQFIAFQVERARTYYQRSSALDGFIDTECRACSRALLRIYRDLLNKIARHPRQILTTRVRLSGLHKAWIGLSAAMRK